MLLRSLAGPAAPKGAKDWAQVVLHDEALERLSDEASAATEELVASLQARLEQSTSSGELVETLRQQLTELQANLSDSESMRELMAQQQVLLKGEIRGPVLRLFPPCALIPHAQGSSGVGATMRFV